MILYFNFYTNSLLGQVFRENRKLLRGIFSHYIHLKRSSVSPFI